MKTKKQIKENLEKIQKARKMHKILVIEETPSGIQLREIEKWELIPRAFQFIVNSFFNFSVKYPTLWIQNINKFSLSHGR